MHTFARQFDADHQSRARQEAATNPRRRAQERTTPVSSRFLTGAALRRRRSAPSGFTLVELLVVISIILLLTVMTIGVINISTSERVRSGARQVQSVVEGARDRAIYAQQPRGVRLLVNEDILDPAFTPPTPTIVSSLVYIGSGEQGDVARGPRRPRRRHDRQRTLPLRPDARIRRASTRWESLRTIRSAGRSSASTRTGRHCTNAACWDRIRASPSRTTPARPANTRSTPAASRSSRTRIDYIPGGYGGMNGMPTPPAGLSDQRHERFLAADSQQIDL